MEYKFIKIKVLKEKVFQISLNNPKSRNAINSIMLDELLDCLDDLSRKKEIRVLIITGEASIFCRSRFRMDEAVYKFDIGGK